MITLSIDARCSKCRALLNGRPRHDGGDGVEVDPCESCIDRRVKDVLVEVANQAKIASQQKRKH